MGMKNPGLVFANLFGITDSVMRNYVQAVRDHVELEGLGLIEAWKATNREPEGLLWMRQFHSKMYTRLHRIGLEKAAQENLFAAQHYGRAYLEATKETRYQDTLHH